jgi:hypothetical protein
MTTLKKEMVDTVEERDKIKTALETLKKANTALTTERDKLQGEVTDAVRPRLMSRNLF